MNDVTHTTQEDDHIFASLKGINFLLKNFQIEAAIALLDTYDRGDMSPGILMYFLFLQARVSIFRFEESFYVQHLRDADEAMTEMICIGRKAGFTPRCPNYLYTRCIIKYKLSQEVGQIESRQHYRDHAIRLTQVGMDRFDLECFNMLHKELMKEGMH